MKGFKMNKQKLEIGNKYNLLTIKDIANIPVGKAGATSLKAFCICDCGDSKWIPLYNIKAGLTVSCGCKRKQTILECANKRQKFKLVDCIGKKFNRLTVLSETYEQQKSRNTRMFVCLCDCGNTHIAKANSVGKGSTKSCGCWDRERKTTHGMHDTRQYNIWATMLARTTNQKDQSYSKYGGRGITCCDKWKTFKGFWEDMKDTYSGALELDRINNNKGYSKENCRWTTRKIQNQNQRKLPNCLSKYKGLTIQKNGNFQVRISNPESKRENLGTYEDEEFAAMVYDNKCEEYYGDRPNKTERID